ACRIYSSRSFTRSNGHNCIVYCTCPCRACLLSKRIDCSMNEANDTFGLTFDRHPLENRRRRQPWPSISIIKH
ncbi:hypothetical protein RDWZM_004653, partial [Blomia tropicalis]